MKAEVGTAKHSSKQLKISGLQKLKFYCQLCSKQCRDANGFKNHLNSPSHKGRIENLSNSNDKDEDIVVKYSNQFMDDFLRLLKMSHGTKKINANRYYQEYISNDRDHIHMNATKWSSLTQFVKHLGQNGYVRVENDNEEDELSFTIALIDRSPEAIKRQEMLMKKQRTIRSDEEMSMKILNQQIERGKRDEEKAKIAKKESAVEAAASKPQEIESGPIKLSLKSNPTVLLKKKKVVSRAFANSDDEDDEEEDKRGDQAAKKRKTIGNLNSRPFK